MVCRYNKMWRSLVYHLRRHARNHPRRYPSSGEKFQKGCDILHVKKCGEGARKWEVFVYVADYTGKKKLKHKRGFKAKREAVSW